MEPLLGKELSEIGRLVLEHGQPAFRSLQIYEGLYRRQVSNLDQIHNLPRGFQLDLAKSFCVGRPRISQRFHSEDGTIRYLLCLDDDKTVEAVFIPEERRDTLCISTQVGCPVDCRFCLTALMGLERNLSAGEIVGQVLAVSHDQQLGQGGRPVNIVMMGMGEPLLNLPAVLKATRLLADPKGMAIPQRRITVSTSGIIPQIDELGAADVRPRLAVSLNASDEESRQQLMPITRKYSLANLIEACARYPLRPWERLTFEYVLLRGVNDSDEDARRVVRLLANLNCKLNLIALNPGPGIPYETPDPERVASFQAIARKSLSCFVRKPRGRDIFAACGQLKRSLPDENRPAESESDAG
jgi:23S rRNA (adenine2503-C2)-methyltransferase